MTERGRSGSMTNSQAAPTPMSAISDVKGISGAQGNRQSRILFNKPVVEESSPSCGFVNDLPHLPLHDHIKTALLLFLSFITFPISYTVALALTILPPSLIALFFPHSSSTLIDALEHRTLCRSERGFVQRTVLVTGVGMTKGLTLARSFWLCGHRVIAADFHIEGCSTWTPWHGRVYSRAFDKVYSLKKLGSKGGTVDKREKASAQLDYIREICRIVKHEGVDLWVSCSGVASAVEDAMVKEALDNMPLAKGARCACIQFDVPTTSTLHEKSSFTQHTKSLDLPVPQTCDVTSHSEALHSLERASEQHPSRKYILKPVGMDDANRGDMTLLPLSTSRDTGRHVRRLPMSKDRPWILQKFIRGGKEYCTHSLVVNGEVRVFAACPSTELLMHYTTLAHDDPLGEVMLEFTSKYAAAAGRGFTGHLSFDFMAEMSERGKTKLYAIECNPRAHTAVALFGQTSEEMRGMVDAYLSAIDTPTNMGEGSLKKINEGSRLVRLPKNTSPRYWIGHDLVTLLVLPMWRLLNRDLALGQFINEASEFVAHVSHWKDGTFELWDPWPFVALYHHYWPRAILDSWRRGERWSRLNVSTTKMFRC